MIRNQNTKCGWLVRRFKLSNTNLVLHFVFILCQPLKVTVSENPHKMRARLHTAALNNGPCFPFRQTFICISTAGKDIVNFSK